MISVTSFLFLFFFLSSFAPPVTLTVTECGGKPTQKRLKCVMSDNTKSTQGDAGLSEIVYKLPDPLSASAEDLWRDPESHRVKLINDGCLLNVSPHRSPLSSHSDLEVTVLHPTKGFISTPGEYTSVLIISHYSHE